MVILFQDPNSLSSSSKDGNPVRQSPSSCSISSRTSLLPPPSYDQIVSESVTAAAFVERSEPAERRFFKALLIALSISVLVGIFVSVGFGLPNSTRRGNAEEGHIDNCVPWTRIPGSEHHRRPSLSSSNMWSQARLNLSTDAHALYLIARGAMKSGAFYVGESHDAKDVSVTVFVHHRDEDTLSHASVCRLSREDGQIGVGLFTSSSRHMPWHARGKDARFVIKVGFPSGRGAIRYIPSFHVDLPVFALTVDDLSAFRFGDFDLKSSNSIKAERVVADTLRIYSTNGAISGNFNTTNSLTFVTTNSPISVRVGAENGEPETSTEVLMQTSNAFIEADISLTSKSSFGAGGTFGVHVHTTNGSIKIVYDDSPADSILKFDAHTTNSPVHAVLHPAYEGTFCLRTTLCKVVLDPLRDVEDPSGLGRKRRWSTHSVNKQAVCGGVDWSPSRNDGRAGSVDIKTTENLIRLSV